MRIAAKRLRYVLEITEPCFGAEAVAARRRRQGAAGRARRHPRLRRDAAPRRGHRVAARPCCATRRELLFRRFRELWQAEASKGTWAALERAL